MKVFLHEKANIVEKGSLLNCFLHKNAVLVEKHRNGMRSCYHFVKAASWLMIRARSISSAFMYFLSMAMLL